MQEKLQNVARLSNLFGADADYVILGGGNTSVKNEDSLYIKPSGVALATIKPENFVKVNRAKLRELFGIQGKPCEPATENLVKAYIENAVEPAGSGRPSIETPLHEVFNWTYIVHLHPTFINGMTCAKNGKAICAELFPDAPWMQYEAPGFALALAAKKLLADYQAAKGAQPHVFFIQNHGVFVGADTPEEIQAIYSDMTAKLKAKYQAAGLLDKLVKVSAACDKETLAVLPALRTILAPDAASRAVVMFAGAANATQGPLMPDQIVYSKSFAYVGEANSASVQDFIAKKGYIPRIVELPGKGVVAAAPTLKDAKAAALAWENARNVEILAEAFGGANYLTEEQYGYIENCEGEAYRRKIATKATAGRLNNRICVVTGGAQGFGLGIAEYLAANGGILVIADMNVEGAAAAAQGLCDKYGADRAISVAVNISDEESVEKMVDDITRQVGGIDLLVANAGVVRAGSVMEISKKDWDFVTNINYTGYFLCCKYVSRVMAAQIVDGKGLWSDIVQVNSKSGLEGSNKNGAYAGSKFGTIGLTQSFAKELVTSCIKVNSVCPGNFYDGPLWSDPVKGLFVQYLQAGKVPGAQTVQDVRRFYEDKVPMRRGCTPPDVAKAIMYCVEQDYETGQAIPVTGGQVMLH